MTAPDDGLVRCDWAVGRPGPDFTLYRDYHDQEWGRALHGPVPLFERMSLEAFQSGLSWLIILRKRENFRRAFSGFDIETVARYTDADVARLMADQGIVRNRAKIEATIANARAVADVDRLVERLAAEACCHVGIVGEVGEFAFGSDILPSRDVVQPLVALLEIFGMQRFGIVTSCGRSCLLHVFASRPKPPSLDRHRLASLGRFPAQNVYRAGSIARLN